MSGRRLALAVLATLVLGAAACEPAAVGDERPVARVDGEALTIAQLELYLSVHLPMDGDDPEPGDLVRSRLLDTWIDEHLLLAEATERRLTIPEESLEYLLDDPEYESSEEDRSTQRENLRARLMIEMLQGQVLQDIVLPTTEHAEAWLAERQDPGESAGRSVELRSLRFDDGERALAAHRGLRRNRLTFGEAVLQNTEDESQGVATVVEWAALPPEVQAEIEKLGPGWSSKPVELGGSTYLFQVVRWIEVDPDARIEAAREEIFAAERRAAWETFVVSLRDGARIKIYEENLPFRLVSP